jgi:transposase
VPARVPGQIVVTDNPPAHHAPRADEPVGAAGAYVPRLPPYSPDPNPIEMAPSKVKALLRQLARRTVVALQAAADEPLAAVSPDDITAYVRHCGYSDTRRG